MKEKINPKMEKVHPSFVELLIKLQTDRIKYGNEDANSVISRWRLTKTIVNFFESNKEAYKSIVEVKINV